MPEIACAIIVEAAIPMTPPPFTTKTILSTKLIMDDTTNAYNGIFVSPKLLITAPSILYSIEKMCIRDRPLAELEAENRRYYQKELPQGGHIACFVYIGEEIVGCGGMCLYHEMPSPDNPSGKCAYLMNVYVRPQFRGHGIASRLVRWLVEQAREHQISKRCV